MAAIPPHNNPVKTLTRFKSHYCRQLWTRSKSCSSCLRVSALSFYRSTTSYCLKVAWLPKADTRNLKAFSSQIRFFVGKVQVFYGVYVYLSFPSYASSRYPWCFFHFKIVHVHFRVPPCLFGVIFSSKAGYGERFVLKAFFQFTVLTFYHCKPHPNKQDHQYHQAGTGVNQGVEVWELKIHVSAKIGFEVDAN